MVQVTIMDGPPMPSERNFGPNSQLGHGTLACPGTARWIQSPERLQPGQLRPQSTLVSSWAAPGKLESTPISSRLISLLLSALSDFSPSSLPNCICIRRLHDTLHEQKQQQ